MSRRYALALLAAIVVAAFVQAWVMWPGVMLPDAIEQYTQALTGRYDDWHPPIVAWIWHLLIPMQAGPAPMLLLQLGLYWGGLALLAASALRRRRTWLAAALAACGLMPIAYGLMTAVLKDSLLAAFCTGAAGLLAWSEAGGRRGWRLAAALLLLMASATRVNAVLATLPLLVALLPKAWRRTPARLAVTSVLAALPLLLSGPIVAKLVQAHKSRVELSMLLFDIGGTTARSGVDLLPPMLPDQLAVNRGCYSSLMWDTYSDPCPITFERFRDGADDARENPYALWFRAVATHPIAYAEHRLTHFNRNIRWLVPRDGGGFTFIHSDINPWGYRITPSNGAARIYNAALRTSQTPFGWPATWLALAGAVLIVGRRLPSRTLSVPLATSALLYGGGYLVISVASDLRYHLWTIVAALLAAVLTAADLLRGARAGRGRGIAAALLIAAVVVPAIAWRALDLPLPGGEQPATPASAPIKLIRLA